MLTGIERLVEPLRTTCTTKVKANSVKQEFEKQDELKRSAMRAFTALLAVTDAGLYYTFFNIYLCEINFFELREYFYKLFSWILRYFHKNL